MKSLKEYMTEALIGMSDKEKGHAMNVASKVSDIPGHWDHKNQKFTTQGESELHKQLGGNKKHVEYAKKLTYKDYEA